MPNQSVSLRVLGCQVILPNSDRIFSICQTQGFSLQIKTISQSARQQTLKCHHLTSFVKSFLWVEWVMLRYFQSTDKFNFQMFEAFQTRTANAAKKLRFGQILVIHFETYERKIS